MRRDAIGLLALAVLGALALGACSRSTQPQTSGPRLRRTVTIVVRDSLGALAANRSLSATATFDSAGFVEVHTGVTDADGEVVLTLAEGGWAAYTGAASGVAGSSFDVPGRERNPADTIAVRLTLSTPSTARGVVTLAGRTHHEGTIVSGTELFVLASTDSLGGYELDLLPPGHWTVTMFHLGFRVGLATANILAPGSVDTLAAVQLVSDP